MPYSPADVVSLMPPGTLSLEEASHRESAWLGEYDLERAFNEAGLLPGVWLETLEDASVIERGVNGVYDGFIDASRTSTRTVEITQGRHINRDTGIVMSSRPVFINRHIYAHEEWKPQELVHGYLASALADSGQGRDNSSREELDFAARHRRPKFVQAAINLGQFISGNLTPETHLAVVYGIGFLNEVQAGTYWRAVQNLAKQMGAKVIAAMSEVPATQEPRHGNTYYGLVGEILEDNPLARTVLRKLVAGRGLPQVGNTLIGDDAANRMGQLVTLGEPELARQNAKRADARFGKLPGMAGLNPITDLTNRLAA